MDRKTSSIKWQGIDFELLPEKALYAPIYNTLFIADLHLGKISHLRKHGHYLPEEPALINFKRLSELIERYPELTTVYILGDLSHSDVNNEIIAFFNWLHNHKSTQFTLIAGNHDKKLLKFGLPQSMAVKKIEFWNNIVLNHEPMEEKIPHLCGHIHPGIRLVGKAKQSLKLPAFVIKNKSFILPAFGEATGKYILNPKELDEVYLIANNQVIPFKQ